MSCSGLMGKSQRVKRRKNSQIKSGFHLLCEENDLIVGMDKTNI